MATDYFLKLDGIDGESTDEGHPNEIVVGSWSLGVSTVGPPLGGSGGGATKPALQMIHFTKPIDGASVRLFVACCANQRLKTATLTCRKTDPAPFDALTITMSDVVVASDGLSGNGDGSQEQLSLSFSRVLIGYVPLDPTGQPLPPVTGGWDVVANRKL